MEGKRRFSVKRSLLSALLAAAMVITNVSGELSAVWAAQTETVEFEIQGSDLADEIREAVESGSPVTEDDLNFTEGAVDKFENLFFDTGKIYEVYPPLEGGDPYGDGDVRFFVRLPEDADDTYELTGDEEVIFLYVNSGEETLRFTTNVWRTEDGDKKVESTEKISVKAYEEVFGEEDTDDNASASNSVRKKTSADDLVAIDDCAAAKTYTAALSQLMAVDEVQEFSSGNREGMIAEVKNADGDIAFYATLQEAIDQADEAEILLLNDTIENIISIDKSYTLDLQNHTVAGAEDANMGVFAIEGGTVTIQNGVITGGTTSKLKSKATMGGGVNVKTAHLTLSNCTITGNKAYLGGGIYVGTKGSVILEQSEVSQNIASIPGSNGYVSRRKNLLRASHTADQFFNKIQYLPEISERYKQSLEKLIV